MGIKSSKINIFIKGIEFNADGTVFLSIQKEFEITLLDNSVVKQPWQMSRELLAVDDPRTEELTGALFAPFFLGYWAWFKQQNTTI